MKLYRISVSYELLVAAEDEDAAAAVGIYKAELALREMPDAPDISVSPIEQAADLPKEWRGCYPYRGDNLTPMQCEGYVS